MKKIFYTGVGSRETPIHILKLMTLLSSFLESHNFVLRTGDAEGADYFFSKGVKSIRNKEIYNANHAKKEDFHIAEKIHPAWNKCSDFAKKLHTRNLYQVKGILLNNPSDFLICYTKNGQDVGGTRTAIVYARENGINVFNFGKKENIELFMVFLKEKYGITVPY